MHHQPLTPPVEAYFHNAAEDVAAEAMGHLRAGAKGVEHPVGEAAGLAAEAETATAEAEAASDQVEASAPAGNSLALIVVDVLALYERLCARNASVGTLWSDSCCAPGALSSLVRGSGDEGPDTIGKSGLVATSAVPSFLCSASAEAGAMPGKGLKRSVRISCAAVRDDYCDCTADGADEDKSAACAAVPGARFRCSGEGGAKRVVGGELLREVGGGGDDTTTHENSNNLFISASFVRDGVEDCFDGEDEKGSL